MEKQTPGPKRALALASSFGLSFRTLREVEGGRNLLL